MSSLVPTSAYRHILQAAVANGESSDAELLFYKCPLKKKEPEVGTEYTSRVNFRDV
jgi:hypothetical protein